MPKNRYYLLARNRSTNKITKISLSDYDIYNEGSNIPKKYNSLEEIDLFTMSLYRIGDILMYLVNTNKLDNYDNELFIVKRGKNDFNYLEIIKKEERLTHELNKLATSKDKSINYSNETIINNFIVRFMTDNKFRNFIESKYHNIYIKFVDYYSNCHNPNLMYQQKYKDGGWSLKSYTLLRNIVEAINRYDLFPNKKDIKQEAFEYQNYLLDGRKDCSEEIMFYTAPEYSDGQLSIFNQEKEPDKLSELDTFIDNLPTNTFELRYNADENEYIPGLNKSIFYCTDTEKELLSNLDSELIYRLYEFLINKEWDLDSVEEYQENLKNSKTAVMEIITKDENQMNRLYAFSQLYNKLKAKDKIYIRK